MPLEQKVKIFEMYMEEVGEKITAKTVYRGYKIGMWQANLRADERNKRVSPDMTYELKEKLHDMGILSRERKERVTDEEKVIAIEEYMMQHPDEEILTSTVAEDGTPVGQYVNWLSTKYNRQERLGKQILSLEVEKKLVENHFYKAKKDKRVVEISKKLGISLVRAAELADTYGNLDGVIMAYKQGQIDKNTSSMFKNIKLLGYLINAEDLDEKTKNAYIDFALTISKKSKIKNGSMHFDGKSYSHIRIFDRLKVDEVLDSLSEREKTRYVKYFKLDGADIDTRLEDLMAQENVSMRTMKERFYNCLNRLRRNNAQIEVDQISYKKRYNELKKLNAKSIKKVGYITENQRRIYARLGYNVLTDAEVRRFRREMAEQGITLDENNQFNGMVSVLSPYVEQLISEALLEKAHEDFKQKDDFFKGIYEYYYSDEYSIFADNTTKSANLRDDAQTYSFEQNVEELNLDEKIIAKLKENNCLKVSDLIALINMGEWEKIGIIENEVKLIVKDLGFPLEIYRDTRNNQIDTDEVRKNSQIRHEIQKEHFDAKVETLALPHKTKKLLERKGCSSIQDIINYMGLDMNKIDDEEYIDIMMMRLKKNKGLSNEHVEYILKMIKDYFEQNELPFNYFTKNKCVFDMNIEVLGLSARSYNALSHWGAEKISDIIIVPNFDLSQFLYDNNYIEMVRAKLSTIRNLGQQSVEEVIYKTIDFILEQMPLDEKQRETLNGEAKKILIQRFIENSKILGIIDEKSQETRAQKASKNK